MRTKFLFFILCLALLAGEHQAAAQKSQFFRIAGPTATTIITLNPDGTLVWTNAQTSSKSYTVQSATSLLGGSNWADYVQLAISNHLNTNQIISFHPPAGMAYVPAGVFLMGDYLADPDITDANPVTVYVSAFVMDVNLVNYRLWTNVWAYGTNHGYRFVNAGLTGTGGESGSSGGTGTNFPVGKVDWFDCVKWCNARSQQAGLTPVYYTDPVFAHVFTNGETSITVYQNLTVNGYRLPTEAEWEKAARAGRNGLRFPWGNTIQNGQAQYVPNPSVYSFDLGTYNDTPIIPATVGSFPANGYGLYDMAGNMFEWCWDWYGTPYGMPTTTDPTGATSGSSRILRGGGWGSGPNVARCANRYSHAPTVTHACYGFRCVRAF